MPYFELTLKGYDPTAEETDNLVKWVKAPDERTLIENLRAYGVMAYVRNWSPMQGRSMSFEDGLDIEIYFDNFGVLHHVPTPAVFSSWIEDCRDILKSQLAKKYEFRLRSVSEIHMCCIENRNTEGCARLVLRIPGTNEIVGYVFPEHADKVPKELEVSLEGPIDPASTSDRDMSHVAFTDFKTLMQLWLENMGSSTAEDMVATFESYAKALIQRKPQDVLEQCIETILSVMFDRDSLYGRWKCVRVTQVNATLSDHEDRLYLPGGNGGKGSHQDYPVPGNFSTVNCDKELVLDWFHSEVAIGCLDDFHVEVIPLSDECENVD